METERWKISSFHVGSSLDVFEQLRRCLSLRDPNSLTLRPASEGLAAPLIITADGCGIPRNHWQSAPWREEGTQEGGATGHRLVGSVKYTSQRKRSGCNRYLLVCICDIIHDADLPGASSVQRSTPKPKFTCPLY